HLGVAIDVEVGDVERVEGTVEIDAFPLDKVGGGIRRVQRVGADRGAAAAPEALGDAVAVGISRGDGATGRPPDAPQRGSRRTITNVETAPVQIQQLRPAAAGNVV